MLLQIPILQKIPVFSVAQYALNFVTEQVVWLKRVQTDKTPMCYEYKLGVKIAHVKTAMAPWQDQPVCPNSNDRRQVHLCVLCTKFRRCVFDMIELCYEKQTLVR